MVNPNRKLGSPIRLTKREREALLGVIEHAIARMTAMGRDPELLIHIREKVSNSGG